MCKVGPTQQIQVCASWPFPSRNRVTEKKNGQLIIFFTRPNNSPPDRCAFLEFLSWKNPGSYTNLTGQLSASIVALMAVIISVVATVASAQSEAPAPSPTSGSGAISASVVSAGVAAVAALVFGSALRI
ncbi:Arabinogalactan protein 15 [Cardamine amara subsp. amara]|uniref:Arabinogalactan protein 15 n=1 Tax=Cardamine amara subsp. amara TaxID=228776 RepID=A0ABD1A5U5_CARAN